MDGAPKRRRHRDDMYEFQKYIGRGGMAVVELWRKRWDDEALVVAKRVYLGEMSPEEEEKTRAESQYLKRLRHPYIVRYSASWVNKDTNDLLIIQEYCGGGDLAQFIKSTIPKKQLISAEKVLRWLAQLIHALLYCHKTLRILHRDLKPSNVFLAAGQEDTRLGDFGVATILSSTQSLCGTVIGTQVYMSPEILRMQKYGLKTDVWGLGCIAYELCTLKRPFDTTDPIAVIRAIVASERPPPFGRPPYGSLAYPAEIEALCFAMLQKDVDVRPTFSQLLLEHSNLRTAVVDLEHRVGWEESLVPAPSDSLGCIEEDQFEESCPTHRSDKEEEEEEEELHQVEQQSKAEPPQASAPRGVNKYKGQGLYDAVLEAFQRCDLNRDGMLDRQELADVFRSLDSDMWDDAAVQELFKAIDVDADDRIQLEEWLEWVFESERGRSYRERLKTDGKPLTEASPDTVQKAATPAKKGLSLFAQESKARLLAGSTVTAGSSGVSGSTNFSKTKPAAMAPSLEIGRTDTRGSADLNRIAAVESPESALSAAAEISSVRELTLRQKELRQLLASVPEYAPKVAESDPEDVASQPLDSECRPQTSPEGPSGMPPLDAAMRTETAPASTARPATSDMTPLPTSSACDVDGGSSSCWTCPTCDEPNKFRTQCNNCGAPRPVPDTTAPPSQVPAEESAPSSCWTCPACDEPNKRREQCNNCGAPRPSSHTAAPGSEPEKEQLSQKAAVIDARLRCIEAMQAPGDPDPAELTLALRQARELELGQEESRQALLSHTVRLCFQAEDTIARKDAPLPAIERSTELLESVQTEAQVPDEVVQRASQRLQRAQEEDKQLGLRCSCGPIVRRVSVRREHSFAQVKAQVARRWGRPADAVVLQFRQGGSLFALQTEAHWKDCVRVHARGPVDVVVNLPKKAPLAKSGRPKMTLQSMAARSKAEMSRTAPARVGSAGISRRNVSSAQGARGMRS